MHATAMVSGLPSSLSAIAFGYYPCRRGLHLAAGDRERFLSPPLLQSKHVTYLLLRHTNTLAILCLVERCRRIKLF
jgi:hypothetical protein